MTAKGDSIVDPSGRYQRGEELGFGSFKTVFKAYDTYEGLDVAWNQVKLQNVNSAQRAKIMGEITILERVRHANIMDIFHSWETEDGDYVVFITEIMSSGTLKEFVLYSFYFLTLSSYIKKSNKIVLGTIKQWLRQILEGLEHLHSHNPPIIHRDLKCENIFINGDRGQVKIGDLGLSTCKKDIKAVQSVNGTPEFIAPEVYTDVYDERVDVYAFGMCLLEMVTGDYPYQECKSVYSVMQKVHDNIKPKSLEKITVESVREFIDLCLSVKDKRPFVKDLIKHPFMLDDSDADVTFSLSDNNNEEPVQKPKSGVDRDGVRVVMVEHNQEQKEALLKVYVRKEQGVYKQIKFPFDLLVDTPEAVAREVVVEIGLGEVIENSIANVREANLVFQTPLRNTPTVQTPIDPTKFTYTELTNPIMVSNPSSPKNQGGKNQQTSTTTTIIDHDSLESESPSRSVDQSAANDSAATSPSITPSEIRDNPLSEQDTLTSKYTEELKTNLKNDSERNGFDTHQENTSKLNNEFKEKKPVTNVTGLTIHIPRKVESPPVVVHQVKTDGVVTSKPPIGVSSQTSTSQPVNQNSTTQTALNLSTRSEEITKAWLLLLRKQKKEEQEQRERHKRERDEFRRSYGISISNSGSTTTTNAPTNSTSISNREFNHSSISSTGSNSSSISSTAPISLSTPVGLNASSSTTSTPLQIVTGPQADSKTKNSPTTMGSSNSINRIKVIPSKQMKNVFEKLISDVETRICEDFKYSNSNDYDKFTTTTQIVNELKKSQNMVYKITTTTMTTTSSINIKAQQIIKKQQQQQQQQLKYEPRSPPVMDNSHHDVSTDNTPVTTPLTTSMTPKDVTTTTPVKLIRSEYSKSTGNLGILDDSSTTPTLDLHSTLPIMGSNHQHSYSEPVTIVAASNPMVANAQHVLKRSNTTTNLPGDDLTVLMTKNLDSLMSRENSANSNTSTPTIVSLPIKLSSPKEQQQEPEKSNQQTSPPVKKNISDEEDS
ncbi:hypothetical protein AKO1_010821 [Acrasis kona]|uniref:Protein kinase domain-containing protein n=1 Tax=Acrasis kona TaxID=1008807 RepID=A0AAW2YKF3_9EUKA